jgi:putative transposase
LKIIGIAESTYYYQQKPSESDTQARNNTGRPISGYSLDKFYHKISDEQIKEWLMELIAGEESNYGYRKLTKSLRRQYHLVINKKKTYRLCKELGIVKRQRLIKPTYPRRLARNRIITSVNQLWEMDIKYGYVAGEDRFFYLMCIIDVYDREIVDYHIGLNCEGAHAAHIIERALWKRKLINTSVRPVIRTDNGPQFISNIFGKTCANLEMEHERIPPKTPNLNAHIESFHSEFNDYGEAYKIVTEFIDFYNHRYLHGSLGDIPPREFHDMIIQTNTQPFLVTL